MKRSISMVYAGLIAMMIALPALAQQTTTMPPPDYMYRHHHMWHGGFLGPLLIILVILVLVALFMRFGFWGRHYGDRYRRSGGALDILEERFARGEIDKAEFEEKRKLLMR
jgi:putative membrane protein